MKEHKFTFIGCFVYVLFICRTSEAIEWTVDFDSNRGIYDSEHPLDKFSAENLVGRRINSEAKLTVNVSSIDGYGEEWVKVEWNGINSPRDDDIIALFAVGYEDTAPIKFLKASESETHLTSGYGSLEAKLLNHRVDVQFRLIRSFFMKFSISLAESEIIKVKNKDAPHYVHLALTDTHNEMRVQWVSASPGNKTVKWGNESGKLTKIAVANSTTYKPEDLCKGAASGKGYIDPGYMHSAVITDLVPGKKYFYVFGSEEGGFSEERIFAAPPEVGSADTVKIIGLADMGQYNVDFFENPEGYLHSLDTSININKEDNVDLVMHVGDISYAQGYVADWDVFFDQMNPLVSCVPYMTVPGNHERDSPGSGDLYGISNDSGGECGVAYEKRLQMPAAGVDKPWYSFDFGPIHFTTFSTEHEFKSGSEQYEFLEKDLKGVDRDITPWVIVCFHRPMYPGITKDFVPNGYWVVAQRLQKELADLFLKYQVDMLWSGHHHSYQRTCPVHKEECLDPSAAPVQLVFGNSGARLYTNLVKRDFIEYQEGDFGYIRANVSSTELHVEAVRNSDLSIMDSITLYKETN